MASIHQWHPDHPARAIPRKPAQKITLHFCDCSLNCKHHQRRACSRMTSGEFAVNGLQLHLCVECAANCADAAMEGGGEFLGLTNPLREAA